jgi:hypothetical protein
MLRLVPRKLRIQYPDAMDYVTYVPVYLFDPIFLTYQVESSELNSNPLEAAIK